MEKLGNFIAKCLLLYYLVQFAPVIVPVLVFMTIWTKLSVKINMHKNRWKIVDGNDSGARVSEVVKTLPYPSYTLSNLNFKVGENTYHADHVVITENGVFCISDKNYKYFVYGKSHEKLWVTYLKDKRINLISPLYANGMVCSALKSQLPSSCIVNNLVVFTNDNANVIDAKNVVNLKELYSYIREQNNNIPYTEEEMQDIYNRLIKLDLKKSRAEIIKAEYETLDRMGLLICPKCSNALHATYKINKKGDIKIKLDCPNCTFKNLINW